MKKLSTIKCKKVLTAGEYEMRKIEHLLINHVRILLIENRTKKTKDISMENVDLIGTYFCFDSMATHTHATQFS